MNSQNTKETIDINKLLVHFWKNKILILCISTLVSITTLVTVIFLPNIYTSSALVAPSSEDETLSSQLGQFSSIAGLAGISVPSGKSNATNEAVERIQSFDFFSTYFLPNIKLEDLLAVKDWDQISNNLTYDPKLFDKNKMEWVRKVNPPKELIPSDQEAFTVYKKILYVSENKENGFVTISISHRSATIAKAWVDIIIKNINTSMRELDQSVSSNSIDFLNEMIIETNNKEIREVLSDLLATQMQNLMLASANENYVFKILDSPQIPERKSAPSRLAILIIGTIIGFILGLIISTIKFLRQESLLDPNVIE